ncbi:unnamed protein product [Vitrella brassicaformis CCMP3155]|uniref:Uncharacterized protein n=1 Tax=Vitrella brassicaformis (strain CCMP3155) TaxID=1169540 RepID=A0A0G4G971_VITBC|nr:unnamed protein product [Vitrella brassicaformis CCMP3155]|eukprot:CEM25425.1 unnamed protein product [Vitrella brassicaformis CCMP3155]
MREGSREPALSHSDIDLLAADLLSADPSTFTAAARKVADACVNERLSRKRGRDLLRRFLADKGLRRILTWLLDNGNPETQLAAADLLLFLMPEIRPALAALQPSQLVDVAGVVVDVVTWREAAEGGSRCYGPDESLFVKHAVKADAAVDVVTYLRLALLAEVIHALYDAVPDEGARLRDLFLASHQTTLKQCLTVMRTDMEGSISRTALAVLQHLVDDELPDIPLHLSLPLFSLLVDHLLKLAEGATHMDPQGWRRALELPGVVVAAVTLSPQAPFLREEDVKRLVEEHLNSHVAKLVGIIASAEEGLLAVAAVTLGPS